MEKIIPINITKGHVTRISLDFKDKDNVVDVVVTVQLKSDRDENITELCLSSTSYYDDKKLTIPIDMIPLASQVRTICENACIEKINGRFAQIAG